MKVKTKTKEVEVNWCGVSTIDGMLWMEIPNSDILTIASTFGNVEETAELIYKQTEKDSITFENYTNLYNMYTNFSGIVIALKRETS